MDLEAERARERRSKSIAVVVAVVLHIGFVLSIPEVRETIGIDLLAEADLVEDPPPPPPPPPEPEPERVIERVRPTVRRDTPNEAPPQQAPEPPPPAAPPPADFTDMTLANNSGAADSVPAGEPGGVPGGVRGGTPGGQVGGQVGGTPGGTGTQLTRANLSRPPSQPGGLNDAALQRNFPLAARRTGTPGVAIVRITLGPDGNVRSVSGRSETPAGLGFASACRQTILENGSGWQPALDMDGRPGTYTFSFRCQFDTRQ